MSASGSPSQRRRMVVLISGSGSNLQALLDATESGAIPNTRIDLVISNRKAAYGLQRAANAGVPTSVLSLKTWQTANPGKSREDYDQVLARHVLGGSAGPAGDDATSTSKATTSSTAAPPDLVVLAGFMHILSERFLEALGSSVPIINLHPALPGAFDGASAIERAFEAFQEGKIEKTGVMVHEVVADVDRGAPVVVEEVPIHKGESVEQLEDRIHQVEHRLIVQGARKMLERAGPL